ncbi:MAG: 4Fe-4S binding protein [Candidatus Heimdallarchaeota archaeon]|nr:4Fe-4S binding protein [Candidatus Heimdallarchaeota archaeon]MDH5645542.1 4Fe-4S binding protein [Candidatus Heimdallarchaeota archaeon]
MKEKSSNRKIHPIVRPMAGVAGRTSEWRTQRPELKNELCTKCMMCVIHCPDDVINLDTNGFPVIDQYYCKGCMICQEVCPHSAIDEIETLPGGEFDA